MAKTPSATPPAPEDAAAMPEEWDQTRDHDHDPKITRFPGRFRQPPTPEARLDQAVTALDQANQNLRDSVARWQDVTLTLLQTLAAIAENLRDVDAQRIAASPQENPRPDPRPD